VQNRVARAEMFEDQARVNQIECGLRQHVGDDVMPSYLDIGEAGDLDKMARVKIGREYAPVGAHTRRQPFRDRAAASPRFKASPTCANTSTFQQRDRAGIQKILDRV
jgi:hypothetical protein